MIKGIIKARCGLLVFMLLSQGLFAKPEISESSVYYNINATTRHGVWNQIKEKSPRGEVNVAGNHAVNVAMTHWSLSSNVQYHASLFKCRLSEVSVGLKVTIHLPYWENSWQAEQPLVDEWSRYVRMVSTHESIHQRYSVLMAEELENRLNELGVYKTCKSLKSDVEKIKNEVIGKYKAKNIWFDAQEFVYQKELRWF